MREGLLWNNRHEFYFRDALTLILYFDRDGQILEGNQHAMESLGYEDGFEGVYIQNIFRGEFSVTNGQVYLSDQAKELLTADEHLETVAYRKNQTCFSVDTFIRILEENGEFLGVCGASDISIQKEAVRDLAKAKETAKEADTVRNEFVANVTHELRTPVNGILGHAKNLQELELTRDMRKTVDIIETCCINMQKIINNLLDFSKLEAGKFTIEQKEFHFRELIDRTMSLNITQVNDKGLRLLLNVGADIPDMLIGDELRISQILNNLLSNSIKFTDRGQIVVDIAKTMEKNDEIELFFMVIDSGIGIAENEKDKLFKSFSQVDASITRRFGGTGLGLSIVKQLIELMGGQIKVESEKGKGSTFSFNIRMKKSQSQPAGNAYPSGKFIYDGMNKRALDELTKEESKHLHIPQIKNGGFDMESVESLGIADNIYEIKDAMDKLILCIEMDNWEKAETFAGTVKRLVGTENQEIKRTAFRMEMSIRKEDYEPSLTHYNTLKQMLEEFE